MSCCKDKKFRISLLSMEDDISLNYRIQEIFPKMTFGQANTIRILAELGGSCNIFEGTEEECGPIIEKLMESNLKFTYKPK